MPSRSKCVFFLSATLFVNTAANCGSSQVLFQSNAYADSLADGNQFRGGSVIASQEEWDEFLGAFKPNIQGESLARTDIDFDEEKVIIATYATSATCSVTIDDARIDCDTAIKLTMNVFDASLGCNIKCMAVGQVLYAVAVPAEWQVDTNDIVIEASGGCVEEATTSSTEEVYQKLELIQYSLGLDECDIGECHSPNGTCADIVSCYADPCDPDLGACEDGETCTANYCGGCHAVCTPDVAVTTQAATTVNSTIIDEIILDTTTSATENGIQGDEEVTTATSSTELNVTVPATTTVSPTIIDEIILDTTTSATNNGVQEDEVLTTAISRTEPNNVDPVEPSPVPTDDDLCSQIGIAFKSSALSRYIVLNGKSGASLTTVTSQDELNEILAGFMPMSPGANTTELESTDFATQQVIFATYYESSSCNVEIITANHICEGTTVNIGMAILDESAGCEMACDAEGQVVYAIVTPIGATASLDAAINGPCLEDATLETVTVATESTVESTETPSTIASTTAASGEISGSKTDNDPNQTTKPDLGNMNLPEGLPRDDSSSMMGSLSSVMLLGVTFLFFHLS